MTFEGRDPIVITCREDEDVISAGLRQNVLLVSDCREGMCGACRGFLEEGRYDSLLTHSQHALSDRDEEEGWVLACRLRPRSDLSLDFDYAADRVGRLDAARRAGRIVALDRLSSSVVRIVVRTLAAQEPLRWEAGQHVRLLLPDGGLARAYSIANLASDGHRRATLIFGVSTEDKLFGQAQIDAIVAACPGLNAHVTVAEPTGSWTGQRGTAVDVLAQQLAQSTDPKGCDYYISGPAPMVEAAQAVMERFDIPQGAIHRELHIASGGHS